MLIFLSLQFSLNSFWPMTKTFLPCTNLSRSLYRRGAGHKGLRWCGLARFLVRFCGDFYFKLRYCGFTKPSGLQYLQIFGNFNAVCGFLMLFCAVFIHISVRFCGIQTPAYAPLLESDLDKLVAWSQTWQINFLSSKCYALCYIQDSHW